MDGIYNAVCSRRRRACGARVAAALLVATLLPAPARALMTVSLVDPDDPVPPGAVLTYVVELDNVVTGVPYCFNPPAECVSATAICSNQPPSCVGDGFIGFTCTDAKNQGARCEVGDPPLPDPSLCIANDGGVCNGGINFGARCNVSADCPGTGFVCRRAVNEGTYCGLGLPAAPQQSFCLSNPAGVCSAGPNFNLPCHAAHGQPTDECPANEDSNPVPVTVTLPIPANTTFLDATSGGTSDGTTVSWTLPPLGACNPAPGTPCVSVTVRLTVDPAVPIGTQVRLRATATDRDGPVESALQTTTLGIFGRTRVVLGYPRGTGKDFVLYRTRIALMPGQAIDPGAEGFRLQIAADDPATPGTPLSIVDIPVTPGSLSALGAESEFGGWSFRAPRGVGLNRLLIQQQGQFTFGIRLGARRLDFPDMPSNSVIITITIGDDVFTQQLDLIPNSSRRKFTKSS